jgi:hypothetical protein
MKKFALIAAMLFLTSCSGGGTSAPNEDAFISGNGSILQISPANREVVPNLSGKTLDGTFTQSSGTITIINVWASWCSAKAFVKRFKITYPTLVDDALLVAFPGVTPNAIPTTLILDKRNRVAARISGEALYTDLKRIINQVAAEQ